MALYARILLHIRFLESDNLETLGTTTKSNAKLE